MNYTPKTIKHLLYSFFLTLELKKTKKQTLAPQVDNKITGEDLKQCYDAMRPS